MPKADIKKHTDQREYPYKTKNPLSFCFTVV